MRTTLFLSIIFLVSACSYVNRKQINNYSTLAEHLNSYPIGLDYDKLFHDYYFEKAYFPKSIYDFYNWVSDSVSIEMIKKRYLLDPFVIDENLVVNQSFFYPKVVTVDKLIAYIPLYDRELDIPVSYIFLARGEDRVFNNNVNEKFYVDDWTSKIKAYNLENILSEIDKTVVLYPIYYKQQKRFLGTHHLCFDDTVMKQIHLQGDTIFWYQDLIESLEKFIYFPYLFYYPKFSIWKAYFGKKDYIIGFGKKAVKYEIVQEK